VLDLCDIAVCLASFMYNSLVLTFLLLLCRFSHTSLLFFMSVESVLYIILSENVCFLLLTFTVELQQVLVLVCGFLYSTVYNKQTCDLFHDSI